MTNEMLPVSIDASRLISKIESKLQLMQKVTFTDISELRYYQGYIFGLLSLLYTLGVLDDAQRLEMRYKAISAEIEQYL